MKFTITHLKGSRAGETHDLDGEVITIGRDPGNSLAFDPVKDDAVSSFHANLTVQGGLVIVTDLGSRNGTFLNSHKITGPTPVPPGAVLQFGDKGPMMSIIFGAAGQKAGAPAQAAGAKPVGTPVGPAPAAGAPAAPKAAATPAVAAAATPPAPAAAKPAAAAAPAAAGGKKPFPVKCCAALGALLLACVLGSVAVALRDKIADHTPPGLLNYVKKIPGVDKLFKVPAPPKLPPGVKLPPMGSTEKPATTEASTEKPATTEASTERPASTEKPPATDTGKK